MKRQELTIKSHHPYTDVETLQRKVDRLRKETQQILKEVKSFSFIFSSVSLAADEQIEHGIDLDDEIRKLEVRLIKRALEITDGNQIQAARLLNIKHTTLNAKIKRYGINHKELILNE